MAKRTNMKAEKAKRNAENALKYKKKKRSFFPRSGGGSRPEGGGFGGNDGPRPEGSTGPSSSPNREMHAAVCSACGAETTLPFKPTSGKPVYCRACFQKAN